MQALTALEQTGPVPGTVIFIEGGFRKNQGYHTLFSVTLPNNRVFLTGIAEATALGAAMTVKMALTNKKLPNLSEDFERTYQEVFKTRILELYSYWGGRVRVCGWGERIRSAHRYWA
jgi:sugar (pentulose or hexulose) kinase